MSSEKINSCDIFCTVVDNYGDIGVSWRLARQLATDYEITTRLWVDDLTSFRKLNADIDIGLNVQQSHGVEIRRWSSQFEEVVPADLVIEAFACTLPDSYVTAMAKQDSQPVWINLEYLSAEDWVEGCHGLSSPHSQLPLTKYFFFPGFTKGTGGLLLEKDLLAQRDKFQSDMSAQQAFWKTLGVPNKQAGELRISLFSYENSNVHGLLSEWSQAKQQVSCLVPEGKILPLIADFFKQKQLLVGDVVQTGNLRLQVIPFLEQEVYDRLLWACDINFVRGEDSCVRAQWAGKPFVWHIYPQDDGIHMAKLNAFLDQFCANLAQEVAITFRAMWTKWNGGGSANQSNFAEMANVWHQFALYQPTLTQYTKNWADELSDNSLALNLLDFSRKVGKIAPFEI